MREYGASGFVVHDPAMAWAYKNCGVGRCSALGEADDQGVLELAKNYGLNFGAVSSHLDGIDGGQRTFGFFFRSDREYLKSELDLLHSAARQGSQRLRAAQQANGG